MSAKPEQGYLSEDLAPKKIPRIHNAARKYAELRDARMAAGKLETEQHTKLLDAMREEQVTKYVYGDMTVEVNSKEKCKVSFASENGDGEE